MVSRGSGILSCNNLGIHQRPIHNSINPIQSEAMVSKEERHKSTRMWKIVSSNCIVRAKMLVSQHLGMNEVTYVPATVNQAAFPQS